MFPAKAIHQAGSESLAAYAGIVSSNEPRLHARIEIIIFFHGDHTRLKGESLFTFVSFASVVQIIYVLLLDTLCKFKGRRLQIRLGDGQDYGCPLSSFQGSL